jgi:hypothetical protein
MEPRTNKKKHAERKKNHTLREKKSAQQHALGPSSAGSKLSVI